MSSDGSARTSPKVAADDQPHADVAAERREEHHGIRRGARDDGDEAEAELRPEAHAHDPAAVGVQPGDVDLPPPRRHRAAAQPQVEHQPDDDEGGRRGQPPRRAAHRRGHEGAEQGGQQAEDQSPGQ